MAIADFAKRAIEEKKKQPKARVADFAKKAVEDKGQTKSVPVSDDKKQNTVKQNTFQVPTSRKSNDSPSAFVSGEIKPNTYTIPENRKESSTDEISAKYSKDNKDGTKTVLEKANTEIKDGQLPTQNLEKDTERLAYKAAEKDYIEKKAKYDKALKGMGGAGNNSRIVSVTQDEINRLANDVQDAGVKMYRAKKALQEKEDKKLNDRYGIDVSTFSFDDYTKWADKNGFALLSNGSSDIVPVEKSKVFKGKGYKEPSNQQKEDAKRLLEIANQNKIKSDIAKSKTAATLYNLGNSTLGAVARGITGAVGTIEDVARVATGNNANMHSAAKRAQYNDEAIKEATQENYSSKWFGGKEVPGLGNLGNFAYNTATGVLENATLIAVSAAAGNALGLSGEAAQSFASGMTSALMGSDVAQKTIIDSKRNGETDGRAVIKGVAAGAAEAITEKYSIEVILKDSKNIFKAGLKSFIAESSEEIASNHLNRLADMVVNHGKDELTMKYYELISGGATPNEAIKTVITDVLSEDLQAGLAGGISGIAMGGAFRGMNNVHMVQAGNQIVKQGYTNDLVSQALNADKNSESYKTAQKMAQEITEGKTPTGAEVARLLQQFETDGNTFVISEEYAKNRKARTIVLTENNELKQRLTGLKGAQKYKEIKNYILEVLSNQPITLSDNTNAIVDKSDAAHIAHDAADKKTAIISEIKKAVEKATLYATDEKVEHRKFNSFRYYEAFVEYGDETVPIYLNVGKGINDSKYHIYDITQKIRETARRINGVERVKDLRSENSSSTDTNISQKNNGVKNNFTQGEEKIYQPVKTFAPDTASKAVKNIESKLISQGASDTARQNIVKMAQHIEQELNGTDHTVLDVFNATVKTTSAETPVTDSETYWDRFYGNLQKLYPTQKAETAAEPQTEAAPAKPFTKTEMKTLKQTNGQPPVVYEIGGKKYVSSNVFAVVSDDNGIESVRSAYFPNGGDLVRPKTTAIENLLKGKPVGAADTAYDYESVSNGKTLPQSVFVIDDTAYSFNKSYADMLKARSDTMQIISGGSIDNTLLVGYDNGGNVTGLVLPIRADGTIDIDGRTVPFATDTDVSKYANIPDDIKPLFDKYNGKELSDGENTYRVRYDAGYNKFLFEKVLPDGKTQKFGAQIVKGEDMETYVSHLEKVAEIYKENAVKDAQRAEEQKAQEAAKAEKEKNVTAFVSDMSPMQQGKVRRALLKNGRYEFIERAIADGKQAVIRNHFVDKYKAMSLREAIKSTARRANEEMDIFKLVKKIEADGLQKDSADAIKLREQYPLVYAKLFNDNSYLSSPYIKPEYRMSNGDNTYTPITKTEYDYAKFLENANAVTGVDAENMHDTNSAPDDQYAVLDTLGLTYDEKSAIMKQQSSEIYVLNEILNIGESLTEQQKQLVENINKAFKKFPAFAGKVYRNIGFTGSDAEARFKDFINEHTGKDTIKYAGFVSASKAPDGYTVPADYEIHIEIESKNGRDLEKIGLAEEKEVAFGTNTPFAITSLEVDGNAAYLKLEELENYGTEESNRAYQDKGNGRASERGNSETRDVRLSEEVYSENDILRKGSTGNAQVPERQSDSNGRGNGKDSNRHSGNTTEADGSNASAEGKSLRISEEIENNPTPDTISLKKVGDFYEAYGNNAVTLAEKLDLKATYKTVNGEKVQMVGFPMSALESYKAKLGKEYSLEVRDSNTLKGVENNASSRGQDNRQSGKRTDSSDTERPISEVAQSSGRDAENRSNEVRQGFSGQTKSEVQQNQIKGETVTAESLGIKGGDSRNKLTLVTDYEGKATVEQIARAQGLKVVAFSGDYLSITEGAEEFTARGAIQGDTMYVRTDDPDVTPVQIAKHEAAHDKIRKGQVSLSWVKKQAYTISDGEIDKLTRIYANAFYGIEIGDEIPENVAKAIFEEIACDSVASMNFYEYSWGNSDEAVSKINHIISDYMWASEKEIAKAKETRGSPKGEETNFARIEKSGLSIKDGTASFTEKRFADLIEEFSVPTGGQLNGDYSKGYVAYISPDEFLSLTTTNEQRIVEDARDKYGNLDTDTLQNSRQTPFLEIDFDDGEVTGHEGRHRMVMLRDAGVKKVAIVIKSINPEENKYRTKKITDLAVTGQKFNSGVAPGKVTISEIIPLSPNYRDEVREKFVDTESDVKFSLAKRLFKSKEEDVKKYNAQIDSWLKGELNSNDAFELGETPLVLKSLNVPNLPIVMSQDVMAKITGGKHNISLDEIRNIPNAIADPIMVFKSATVDNALVMLTELTDKNGDSVIVAMHLNKYINRIKVNNIASVYGKQGVDNFVSGQIRNGNLKYLDNKKGQVWATSRGLQLPKLVQSNPDNNIVLQKDDIVNTYNTQNAENNAKGYKLQNPTDTEYLTAVEKGDTEKAQAMVADAAKAWGAITDENDNPKVVYHGTPAKGFNIFNRGDGALGKGIYFAESYEYAKGMAFSEEPYRVYLNIKNPLEVDYPGNYDMQKLIEQGYDGIHHKPNGFWVAFNSKQIKSAEAVTYNENGKVIPLSERFNEDSEDIRYSQAVQDHEAQKAENKALREEISRLKAKVKAKTEQAEYWKGETQLTKSAPTVNQNDIKAVTSHYFKDLGMKHISHKTVQDGLTDIAEYILRGDEDTGVPEYGTIKQKALDLADTMIENCEEIDTEKEEQYKRLKEYFKTVTIKVSSKGDIADYDSFRKSLFGKINLSLENGTPIDTIWAELGEMFGKNYFPDEITNPTDQLLQAVDVLNDLSDILHNPFEQYMEDARQDLSNDIIERLLDETVRQKQTAADRLYKKYSERNVRLKTLLSDVRKRRDERIAAVQDSYKAYRERVSDKNITAQLLRVGRRMANKKLPAPNRAVMEQWDKLINQFIGEFDFSVAKVTPEKQAKMSEIAEKIQQLETEYPEYKIDPQIQKQLIGMGSKHVSDLTKQEKIDLTNILLQLEYEIDNANRFLASEERQSVKSAGLQVIRDVQNADGGHKKAFLAMLDFGMLRPDAFVKKIVGYNQSSPLYKAFRNLQDGETAMLDYCAKAAEIFDKFKGKDKAYPQYKGFMDKISGKSAQHIPVTGTLYTATDEDGNATGGKVTVNITPAMRMSIFMHSLNPDNLAHIVEGGIQIPDIDSSEYKKGDIYNAPSKRIVLSLAEIRRLNASMPKDERDYCYAMKLYFTKMSQPRINEVSLKLFGVDKATVENYFPISVVGSFRYEELGAIQADGTVVGMNGRLNERVGSKLPIWLHDANDIMGQSILLHSRFVGLAIPYRDINKLWNVQETGVKDAAVPSAINEEKKTLAYITNIKETVKGKWTNEAAKYMDNLIGAFNKGSDKSRWDTVFGNYQRARIAWNAGVAMKQAASFPTAIAEVGWKPVLKAATKLVTKPNQQLLKQDARYQYRKSDENMDIIQMVDTLTVAHLLPAAEFYVQTYNRDLKVGSDEYNKKVQEVFDDIITKTQPNYTPMERPGFLRSKHTITKALNIFKTQPYQNYNILYDSFGEYKTAKKAYKTQENAENEERYRRAKTKFAWAISSQIAASFVYAAMQALVDLIRSGKNPKLTKKYKDEDGNVNVLTALKGLGINMLTNAGGMIPFGSEVVYRVESLTDRILKKLDKEPIFDAYSFDLEIPAYSIINSLKNDFGKALNQTADLLFDVAGSEKPDWSKLGKAYFGVVAAAFELRSGTPIKNVTNLADSILAWFIPNEEQETSSGIMKELRDNDMYNALDSAGKKKMRQEVEQYAKKTTKGYDKEPDKWILEAKEINEKTNLPVSTYIAMKNEIAGIKGLPGKDGKSIANSRGLLVMEYINSIVPASEQEQRKMLYEAFDVGKTVINYDDKKVKEELAKMKAKK